MFSYLREIIPDRLIRPLKLALLESGVIETDGQYIEGAKALGYRLSPEHRGPIIRVALSDPQTAAKIENSRKTENKTIKLDVHRHLRKQFKRLDVDVSGALNALSGRPDKETGRMLIEMISNKEAHFSVCPYGRVHSVLTRCPSIVRSYLTVDGEPLVELDVANSQPLFLCLVIKLFRETGKKAFAKVSFEQKEQDPYRDMDTIIENTVIPFPQKEEYILSPPSTSSITNRKAIKRLTEAHTEKEFMATERKSEGRTVNNGLLKPDELSFIRLCEDGTLYEALIDPEYRWTRFYVKRDFFEMLFSKNRHETPLKGRFREQFPNVLAVIQDLKRKDYRFLACLLQNLEAHVMINRVCRRIMVEMPEAPIFTIHDSILTTEPYLSRVQEIILEEFQSLGIRPTLRRKTSAAAF